MAKPARPISPAWLPATALVAVVALTGGSSEGDPLADPAAEAAGSTTTTAGSSTTSGTTATTTDPGTTTTGLAAPTTTVTGAPVDPLFLPPVAGASGDPGAPLPDGADLVTVVSITDGDTIDVGYQDGEVAQVRLIGINSPESAECFADEATRVLDALIPVGTDVGMTRDVSDTDQFGRLLRYLWVGGMSVNEESVRRGAAIARRYPPDTALSGRFETAQAAAQETGSGLWAAEACGPGADASLTISDVRFDADGDDNQNLNDEWVQVRNDGDTVVDLTGWVVKDESASHRFSFPTSFTLAAGEAVTIHTGCGDDFGTTLFWCNVGSAVWNNDGDTAFLLDPSGNTHVTYDYAGVVTTTEAPTTTGAIDAFVGGTDCDPSYPDTCIPSPPPDLDCREINHRRFRVIGDDPHGFDGNDDDGLGCES